MTTNRSHAHRTGNLYGAGLIAATLLAWTPICGAQGQQQEATRVLEEIIVTATRRDESVFWWRWAYSMPAADGSLITARTTKPARRSISVGSKTLCVRSATWRRTVAPVQPSL